MPAPRRPASIKEIIEAFSDFPTPDQEGLLGTLSEICRILKRERSRIKPDPPMSQRLQDDLADIRDQVDKARFPESIQVPTEWIERDTEKESRLTPCLSSVTFGEHEH